jgi:hypothetical protein
MLGLLIAAGAFGASTIYLAAQLNAERTQADEFVAQTRTLNARIAELERARDELEMARLAGGGTDPAGAPPPGGSEKPAATATLEPTSTQIAQVTDGDAPGSRPDRIGRPPERSEAMQKMMRSQMRVNFKRTHSELADKLGLGKEDANKLIDLMIEQQMRMAERSREDRANNLTPEQRAAAFARQQEKNQAEIAALIGADKVEAYKAYQESMPARQEVDLLSRQLEANDVSLRKDQRDLMVTALAEERKRVPQPKLSESVSREEYTQAMDAWQEDYNQRASTRASSILDSEQQAAYSEYQQWNKEMRQQFESRRAAREGKRR